MKLRKGTWKEREGRGGGVLKKKKKKELVEKDRE